MKKYAIVLAAGKGTRMRCNKPDVSKVSFPLLGRPMIEWVYRAMQNVFFDETVTVLGYGGEALSPLAESYGKIAWQKEARGTGNAALEAASLLGKEEGITVVLSGDTPLLTDKTLLALISSHLTHHNDLTVLTAIVQNPQNYGRIVKDGSMIKSIVAQKDCSVELEAIHEVNTGVYVFNNRELFAHLEPLREKTEAHLTEAIEMMILEGLKVAAFPAGNNEEALSVNDRYQLSVANKALQRRINREWMLQGVTFEDPDTAYIGANVYLGRDTVIKPNVHIVGESRIGMDNVIGPDTYLDNVPIGQRNHIYYAHLSDPVVDNDADLGPYVRTRKGAHIRNKAHIGCFNELKNADFGEGSKCAHLSYLGDATIGKGVNVGCGTIIANYDGVNKFHSDIDDNVFLGSGTTIISPVHVGKDAFIAAGSTINKDIPEADMAIARARQENKSGYAKVLKEKALAKKKK